MTSKVTGGEPVPKKAKPVWPSPETDHAERRGREIPQARLEHMENGILEASGEVRRLARRQAVTEATLRHLISFAPGGGDRAIKYDMDLDRADAEPLFKAGDHVMHTEQLINGEVLRWDNVTDWGRVDFGGKEMMVPADLLEKIDG